MRKDQSKGVTSKNEKSIPIRFTGDFRTSRMVDCRRQPKRLSRHSSYLSLALPTVAKLVAKTILNRFSLEFNQVFAFGEDSRTLRLASELADLRVGNVNWIFALQKDQFKGVTSKNEKSIPIGMLRSWRWRSDLNWWITVLQTGALPLGYVTTLLVYSISFFVLKSNIRVRMLL